MAKKVERVATLFKKWWRVGLCCLAGWLLAFYVLSNALNCIFGPTVTPDAAPVVIEEPLKILPPPPGYVQDTREPIEIVPPPGYVQKESR